ncbi:MAG TPA: hypothetical protein VFJ90_12430 [Candidatus Didemnitutus sp.]|nr:hypothetical protein [Candidatus Didemnitutus sp.]
MTRLSIVLGSLALLLAGCASPAPLKEKKSEYRPMSSETKQSIDNQSKEATDAAKETTFGEKR